MLCIHFTLVSRENRDGQSGAQNGTLYRAPCPHELANQVLVECQVKVSHYRLGYCNKMYFEINDIDCGAMAMKNRSILRRFLFFS